MASNALSTAYRPAELVLVAGPNGSGKTTIADSYIRTRFPVWPKLNADALLRSLLDTPSLSLSGQPLLRAAQMIDTTALCLTLLGQPFVIETVLSSEKYKSLIALARRANLIFRLVYITTESPHINVERVRQRVLAGGHDVPKDRIISRWHRSMENLCWFAARADRLVVADNSGSELVVVALRHLGGAVEIRLPTHPASQGLLSLQGQLPLVE